MQRQRTSPWHLPWPEAARRAPRWVAAWCAAQQLVEPENRLPEAYTRESTLRQVVRLAIGGRRWRLRLSNLFGDAPLVLDGAAVAPSLGPGRAAVDAARSWRLRFEGQRRLTLAPGQEACSDPFDLDLVAGSDLAVSLELARLPTAQTGHPGSRATSFAVAGAAAAAADWPEAEAVTHWYLIADVEVWCEAPAAVWVAIGDSITDGRGSTTDGNDRWPDLLRQRLWRAAHTQPPAAWPAGAQLSVVQTGLGGNRLLHDGVGPSLASRFQRDVLGRAGVAVVLVQIGINDLGTRRGWLLPAEVAAGGATPAPRRPLGAAARETFFATMTSAWQTLAADARARGVVVMGATLPPFLGFDGYAPDADDEADRQRLNAWIRDSGCFDVVADFDAALRDPAAPGCSRDGLHNGDRLHPSPAGMAALAAAVPLPE